MITKRINRGVERPKFEMPMQLHSRSCTVFRISIQFIAKKFDYNIKTEIRLSRKLLYVPHGKRNTTILLFLK